MKLFWSSILCLLLFLPITAVSQKSMDNPMIRIAMEAYAAQIKENPQDYMAYYNRAKDYFRYGEKDLALEDFSMAILYFPRKESSDLSQAYTLRGLIYQEKGESRKALDDFNEALVLDPNSRYSLIGRADLLYDMGDYDLASRDYELLLRRDARCQEAYLGLARIAYKQNNKGLCSDYLAKAESANPVNSDFYLQRGVFYAEIGEWQKAADDYVHALLFNESDKKAIAALNRLTETAYPQVIQALSTGIEEAQDKGFFYFLRALIHKNNKHYTASINDWNTILSEKYFYTHSIFYNRAYCYFHLGQFEYALDDINTAISLQGDQLPYHIFRSQLYRITGEYEKAAADLAVAATFNPSDVDVLQQRGLLAAEQGDYQEALNYYNEAIIYNADEPYSYILRAADYEQLGDVKSAADNYENLIRIQESVVSVHSLRGFALALLGRIEEAESWIQAVLQPVDGHPVSAEENYYAACLYAMIGKKEQALHYLEEAFKQGYGDYYNVYFESDSPISLESLRNDADFRMLVQQYSSVF